LKNHLKPSFVALCVLLVACGFTVRQCGFMRSDFVRISENGFDPVDNAQDFNDYPWSMEYFVPDGADEGYLYVGTSNNILNGVMFFLGVTDVPPTPAPAEIRRYRPDLGVRGNERAWETVLDMRDQTTGAGGLRYMTSYRTQYDGVNYLYAATMGRPPALWRTSTGEPGDWEVVWTATSGASIRWMQPHNGLLYFATTDDFAAGQVPPQIWATDGEEFWVVFEDWLGGPANHGITCMASYNGWLYACTINYTGFEVWRLEGPGENGAAPVQVVANGGPDPRNEGAADAHVFNGKLYVGTGIVFGYNPVTGNGFKGADLIRIDENDNWETVVGPNSVSGYESGFGHFSNAYLWKMEEHDGWLYAGTFDNAVVIATVIEENPELLVELIKYLVTGENPLEDGLLGKQPSWADLLFDAGTDLYKTRDGDTWEPIFTDGLGDPNNYGIRTMKSVGDCLYLGMANPFDGLEIWRACSQTAR